MSGPLDGPGVSSIRSFPKVAGRLTRICQVRRPGKLQVLKSVRASLLLVVAGAIYWNMHSADRRFRLPTLVTRVGMLPMEPASLVMERRMLRGIKQRAEALAVAPAPIEHRLPAVG